MAKLFNRAKMTTATTGTGTVTLGTAVSPYQSFADAGVADADVISYLIEEGITWELGRGTYGTAGTTLTRGTVLESTNSDAALDLGGAATVAIVPLAEDLATLYKGYMKCSDVKAANSGGGTFTAGAWRTRVINTEDADTGSNMSIASNQITLDAGTYSCLIICPALSVNRHKALLYDTTGTADLLIGASMFCDQGSVETISIIAGRFTIAVQSVLEVRHWCQTTVNTVGFGLESNIDSKSEVYTVAEFWKEA